MISPWPPWPAPETDWPTDGSDSNRDGPPIWTRLAVAVRSWQNASLSTSPFERATMSDYTPHQRKIIDRYYRNFDSIKFQRLSELVGDLYLAEGKKKDRLWAQVESSLKALEFPETRIAHIMSRKDPALLTAVLKELDGKLD